MSGRRLLKRVAQFAAEAFALPWAVLCWFGRLEGPFTFFAQLFALFPGSPGNYCRAAFYHLTLNDTPQDFVVAFGSYFSKPSAQVAHNVSIGSYCVIGAVSIGARTQIASHVQIPSGRRQHHRRPDGRLDDAVVERITIGADCWIGASALVLANLGSRVTVGAGSVVVHPLPDGVVAAGNPARVIRASAQHPADTPGSGE